MWVKVPAALAGRFKVEGWGLAAVTVYSTEC